MSSLSQTRIWFMAARVATLPASIVPVAAGTAAAFFAGHVRWPAATAALFGALLIQIGTNIANDVLDFERGADTRQRLGPLRVTQAGMVSPRTMRLAAAIIFASAALGPGCYLIYIAGWPIVVIGGLSIAAGVAYTGGPYPLAYHGLGDVFVMVFFGLVAVAGTAFVQAGYVPTVAWPIGVAMGCLSTGLLVVNNLRDIPSDTLTGKRTLAVMVGRRATLAEYALLLTAAFAAPYWLWALANHSPWVLLPLAALPHGGWLIRQLVRAHDGPTFLACLRGTAALLLLFCALCCVGMVMAAN